MRIAICDDEQICINTTYNFLLEYLRGRDIEFFVQIFTRTEEIVESNSCYDLVFMDIQAGKLSGITAAKKLLERNPATLIFFITHYQLYLDKAMDISPFRYLTKPLKKARFFESLYVAIKKWKQMQMNVILTECKTKIKFSVNIYDILFIENSNRKTRVVTKTKDLYVLEVYREIKSVLLQNDDFCDSHQSFTVNLNHVTFYDKENVHIEYGTDKHIIHMSRRKYGNFNKKIFKFADDII